MTVDQSAQLKAAAPHMGRWGVRVVTITYPEPTSQLTGQRA